MQGLHVLELLIDAYLPPAVFHWMVKEGFPFLRKRKPWYGLELPDVCRFDFIGLSGTDWLLDKLYI